MQEKREKTGKFSFVTLALINGQLNSRMIKPLKWNIFEALLSDVYFILTKFKYELLCDW